MKLLGTKNKFGTTKTGGVGCKPMGKPGRSGRKKESETKMEPTTFDQLKEEVDRSREKKKEKASASPQPSVARSGASYQITQGDVQRLSEWIWCIHFGVQPAS